MKLIVGLGNPGKEYDGTRHNIGREIVRALADDGSASWRMQKKLHAEVARLQESPPCLPAGRDSGSDNNTLLVIPTTYMNESGKAVQQLLTTYNLQLTNLLIVHDDLDLPLGTLRFSQGSGAAGQKGVQSIIDALGTKDFARLRIGVAGAHRQTTDAADYVLKKFSKDEQVIITQIKKRATEALADYCAHDLAHAMSHFNA